MEKKKVVLIDGHNLLFRMFYGIPSSIKNKEGKEIKAVVGFLGSLKKIVTQFQPYSLVVIFDSETSKNTNLRLDEKYKSDRLDYTNISENENPFSELPVIKQALKFLGIFFLEVSENEADDYIASLIFQKRNEYEFVIVSTDTDFFQLIDNNTKVFVPRGKQSVLYGEEEFYSKYGIVPKQYVLFKSLMGDHADCIPGIQGIGKVTAQKIAKYSSLENYFLSNDNNRLCQKLKENMVRIQINQKLIALNKNIDIKDIVFSPLSSKIIECKTYAIIEESSKNESIEFS